MREDRTVELCGRIVPLSCVGGQIKSNKLHITQITYHTKMEDDQNGRRPTWKTTKMEDMGTGILKIEIANIKEGINGINMNQQDPTTTTTEIQDSKIIQSKTLTRNKKKRSND